MVQQLSLFSAIDDPSYDLFISTIKTISGNPPVLFANVNTIWNLNPDNEVQQINKKNQLVEPNRIKLSTNVPLDILADSDSSDSQSRAPRQLDYTLMKHLQTDALPVIEGELKSLLKNSGINLTSDSDMNVDSDVKQSNNNNQAWSLSMSDIPAAGTSKKVSIQLISESSILFTDSNASSLTAFMNGLGYILDYSYITVGSKFFFPDNLILDAYKIWNFDSDKSTQLTKGGLLLKAYINVSKNTDIERINQAEKSLLLLQKELQGFVEFSIPDRQSMDSRSEAPDII
ncbi:hypothetical protein TPHA_0D03030 [Tetrapisispora phaffii CBS 4417]|uniref:Mediator of RNA polymerase II transcription subunit 18 n=1 Tax=Tetrapisispora phaffii (strain ATCC 24235 / CBS 4417 / NBRC 1672 / NRRL Y-8282 / UCD 70-5) TaxID=1071381 RepID=G8BSW8_TETPH|nr:hypothetical protein TPHA_0D03030 [Tetrapisispora phaffii CBS 4417]CCE62939.1 hypothetical protein TPHA_0D03030 [Tetrapisispora phaffii CBS 4417]